MDALVELYRHSFEMLLVEPYGILLLILPLGLLFTVSYSYTNIEFTKYNLLHALYFALLAYAVIWVVLACIGLNNLVDRSDLHSYVNPRGLGWTLSAMNVLCITCAYAVPFGGLAVAYREVRRVLKCSHAEACLFLRKWTVANIVLAVFFASALPNTS